MSRRTNEADIAAVTEVVRAYYDGMIEGDAVKLGRAFHPRASIVGNEGESCPGRRSKSSRPSARGQPHRRGLTNGESNASRSRATRPWSGLAANSQACGTATTCLSSGPTTLGASSTRRSTHTPRVEGDLQKRPGRLGGPRAWSLQ